MKTFTILFFIFHFSFFIFHLNGEAQIIHIPADYPTIQQGIDAAYNGDTVLVADGLYYENIDFLGKKPLMVASLFLVDGDTNHINNTIINGSQPADPNFGSVVIISSGEDTTSVLCGFTITGGTGTIEPSINYRIGGGIQAGGPIGEIPWIVMRHNRISNNTAISTGNEGSGGGGVIFYNIIMVENEISNNTINAPLRCSGDGSESRRWFIS